MKKKNKLDLVIILLWPILAVLLSLTLNTNLFTSILLFYLVPSLILSKRIPQVIGKASVFALAITLVYLAVEAIGSFSASWTINSIFSFNILGASLEGIIWAFLFVYLTVMFYECYIDKHITNKLYSPKLKYLLVLVLTLFSLFLVLFFGFPNFLNLPYAYLGIGIVFILVPILLEIYTNQKIFSKFLIAAAYFFYFNFIFELTALQLGWWSFPTSGQFIGEVSFLWFNLPLEELLFFIILSAMAILSVFEFFDEDNK